MYALFAYKHTGLLVMVILVIAAFARNLEQAAERAREQRSAALESQRLQRLLEKQAREEREERQRRERALREREIELTEDIDFYIRTRRRFDSRTPLAFLCNISSVAQDPAIITSLANVNRLSVEGGYDETSLREFIKDNESLVLQRNKIGVRHLTPFQGAVTHRVFGYFCCLSCKRDWQSAATYTNRWQKCKACEAKCYPYEQHVLERSQQQSDNLRPHDTGRCERCIELGRLCLPNRYFATD